MPLLAVNDIHTYYGHIYALKGISIKVEQGEVVDLSIGAKRCRQNDHTQDDLGVLLHPNKERSTSKASESVGCPRTPS